MVGDWMGEDWMVSYGKGWYGMGKDWMGEDGMGKDGVSKDKMAKSIERLASLFDGAVRCGASGVGTTSYIAMERRAQEIANLYSSIAGLLRFGDESSCSCRLAAHGAKRCPCYHSD